MFVNELIKQLEKCNRMAKVYVQTANNEEEVLMKVDNCNRDFIFLETNLEEVSSNANMESNNEI